MSINTISKTELRRQLADLGVEPGSVLLVHTAFSKVKPIEDGPSGLIAALEAQLGSQGTLVMPSMSYADEQVFDPASTPCRGEVGVVADTFWRLPHVRRGDNAHAFAASGAHAARITAPSPLDVPHGLDSAVGHVYTLDGYVLLLGVGHGANTTLHLAENLAGVRYRLEGRMRILRDGQPVWFEFAEVNHCCQNFRKMDGWLDARGLQRKGQVGHADARLMRSSAIVETALEHLKLDETVFLHPYGVDEECDAARDSLNR
jgi:aminoglycoside 3-N-acetyltransferase